MNPPAPASRPARETALAALCFVAATVLMTWPQAARLTDGMADLWDAKLNLRILHWDFHQTLRDPLDLFQLNFFHPARYVLAFSENLYGVALFGFPLFALGAPPVVVYNVLVLLGMFLSALSAWALARYVTGDALASLVAGMVYAFLPWRLSQLPHVQHQWGPFLCLLLLFLLRYLDAGERRDLALFGLFFAWNALCNVHFALFSGFLVAVTSALWAMERLPERNRKLRGAILSAVVGGLAFVPFAIPYRRAAQLYGMRRYFGEMLTFSGRWSDFLSAGATNRLYGRLTSPWQHAEGDFFPGLAAVALALYAVAKLSRCPHAPRQDVPRPQARRWATRSVDVLLLATAATWLAALMRPGLHLGPVHLGDPGRVQVFVTALVLVRLCLAFPRGSRYASLGDLLRHGPLPPRLALLLAIAATGILIALGGNTPYYRFLFQSFGDVFGALRAPARGIVLLDLALAVLAAWGLSLATRGLVLSRRLAWTGALLLVMGAEYRAFPLEIHPVEAAAPPVYHWLKRLNVPGAVVEWPLGFAYDFDYIFRQTEHEKPLVNGYSGFFPKPYDQLQAALAARPIPDGVWKMMADLRSSLVIYHPHSADPLRQLELSRLIRRGLEEGRLETLGGFPDGTRRDIAFRLTSAPRLDPQLPAGSDADASRMLAEIVPPFGAVDVPAEGARVAAGSWGYGWALDDSGVAAVEIGADGGPAAPAVAGGARPDIARAYPDYEGADRAGFGFSVPQLGPGPHKLSVTLIARDGGRTTLERAIRIR